jgi:hypothetical protein
MWTQGTPHGAAQRKRRPQKAGAKYLLRALRPFLAQARGSPRTTVVQEEPRHATEKRYASRPGALIGARSDLDGGLREDAGRGLLSDHGVHAASTLEA